jgi:hypothetical protein
MADALIVASARVVEADVVVASDRSWRARLGDEASRILELPLSATTAAR